MARPPVSPISEEMYDSLGPWSEAERDLPRISVDGGVPDGSGVSESIDGGTPGSSTPESLDGGAWSLVEQWPLLEMVESVGGRLQPIEDVVRDTPEDDPGWSVVMDATRAPAAWLPWLAQMGGVRLPQVMTEAEQRSYIQSAPSQRRGSPGAIEEAAQLSLTGTKTVYMTERHGGAYRLTIVTLGSETPDPARLLADILKQKPAGIVLTVSQSTGGDYLTLRDTHTDYTDVLSTFTDYADVESDPTQQ